MRASKETRDAVDAGATALDRDRSYVVHEARATCIEAHLWQIEHIRRGLSEVEAGQLVPGAQARKVIDRLRRS